MNGDRRIILHTGMHKTGSSTIQNVFHANRDFLLEEERLLYPSLIPNLSTALSTMFREDPGKHPFNRLSGLTSEEIAARREKYRDSLETEISSLDWDTLLLSAEGVSFLTAHEISKLREWGEQYASDWTVLVCVRHPVDWTRSVLQERLKRGDTLQQLYEKLPTPKYHRKISNAISVFGRENVRVFDFDTATRHEGGIVGAFAQEAGLSPSSSHLLASRAVRANESLSLEAVRVFDSLNRQRPLFIGDSRAPGRAGPGREFPYLRRIEGGKFDIPDSVKEDSRIQNRDDVAWLNETFDLDLYADVMDPLSRPATLPESQKEPSGALSNEAVDGIAEAIGDMVAKIAFERALGQGRAALDRDDPERAAKMFKEASRLDPDSPQPKKLLEQVAAKQQSNAQEPGSQEKLDQHTKRTSFLSRFRRSR